MARSQPRADSTYRPNYFYRRDLSFSEVAPAIGVGVGVGVAAFYVVRLFLQRTPLAATPSVPRERGPRNQG